MSEKTSTIIKNPKPNTKSIKCEKKKKFAIFPGLVKIAMVISGVRNIKFHFEDAIQSATINCALASINRDNGLWERIFAHSKGI